MAYRLFVLVALSLPLFVNAEQAPGVVLDHQAASTKQYIGSPSIVIAPNGDYIASHDYFGPSSSEKTSAESKVFVSKDRGATWKQVADFHEQFWSNLFTLKGRVYLMGVSADYGRIVLRTSDDNGQTWSQTHYLTQESGYHTAPVPILIHNGYIYRGFEYHPTAPENGWGGFQAFVMWAAVDSDLTKAESWSFSNRLSFPVGDQGDTWLEGNAVVAPDGSIVDILRVDNQQHVAILKQIGKDLKFERFADFPGGATKFTIRYDPVSKLYWTLSNPALPGEMKTVSSPTSIRNTLAVMSSPDLIHWTPRSIVLHHPDSVVHAFEYTDWQFDGKDMIVASRTAFDDEEGGAYSYHNANYLTFHRIASFRKLGTVKLTGAPFTTAEVATAQQMQKWAANTTAFARQSESGAFNQPIGRYGTHTTTVTTRVKTGEAEQHSDWSDVFVVVAGEASIVSGGHLDHPHVVAPGEIRGDTIAGGQTQPLAPGTVVHIDPGIPHQMIVADGKSVSYLAVKIRK